MRLEENRFKAMLERGLGLLAEETARLGDRQALPGDVAFRLYDTYGFPLDLTQDALREQGRGVDLAGFESAMAEQRARARAAWAGSGEAATERVWFELREQVGADRVPRLQHRDRRGGDPALVVNGAPVQSAGAGTPVAVLLNQTPFYAESGGQVGDTGVITGPGGLRIAVTDTQKKLGDLFVHLGTVEAGEARVGAARAGRGRSCPPLARSARITARRICCTRRCAAGSARMSTQKGSLNAPDRLRFDVSQPAPIAPRGPRRGRGAR